MTLEMCCSVVLREIPLQGVWWLRAQLTPLRTQYHIHAQANLPQAPPTRYPRRAEVGGPHLGLGPLPASPCSLSLLFFLINLLHI